MGKKLLFLSLLIILSCQRVEEKIETEKIKGNKIEVDDSFVGSRLIFVQDTLLITSNFNSSDKTIVRTYKLNGGKLEDSKPLIARGRGPLELQCASFGFDKEQNSATFFCFYEGGGLKINLTQNIYDENLWERLSFPTGKGNYKMLSLTDADSYIFVNPNTILLVGAELKEKNIVALYNLDSDDQELKSIGFWVDDDISAKNMVKQGAYTANSTIYKHPTENTFVYACGVGGQYVETFKLDNDNKAQDRKVIMGEKPLYFAQGSNFKIQPSERTKPLGIKYIIPTEKYLYIMSNSVMYDKDWNEIPYKGYSNQHNDLFKVFDWKGNHIKDIELELPAYSLCWDKKSKTLYTVTEGEGSDILMFYKLE